MRCVPVSLKLVLEIDDEIDDATAPQPIYVATRTALKCLNTNRVSTVFLAESGREGVFKWTLGNFSAYVSADVHEGIYLKACAISDTVGAWVRVHSGTVYPKWWGPPAYPGNASPMIKSIIDLINIDFSKIRTVIVDGFYNLQTELPTIVGYGTIFEGDARSGRGFNKDYTASADNKGLLTFGQYAPCVRRLSFASTSGGKTGSAISCVLPGPVTQNGRPEISDCEFSLGDHVNYNLYINGLLATSGGTGYRTFFLSNCVFFGTGAASVWFGGVKFVQAVNCQIHLAGGTGTTGLQMTGTASVPCDRFEWNGGFIDGNVVIDNASCGIIRGNCLGGVSLDSTVSNFFIDGDIAGTFTDNGTDNWTRGAAWKDFSGHASAPSSGTWTSASAVLRYCEEGKTVHFNYVLTITSNGTGAGQVNFNLPKTTKTRCAFAGREVAAVGTALCGSVQAGSTGVALTTVSNTYPGGTGYILVVNGSYEKA